MSVCLTGQAAVVLEGYIMFYNKINTINIVYYMQQNDVARLMVLVKIISLNTNRYNCNKALNFIKNITHSGISLTTGDYLSHENKSLKINIELRSQTTTLELKYKVTFDKMS